ncbi:hypothetical protein C8Q73DRAFT_259849 [Cubamyces lactineus]|nr:hypothetical protein C8Q73DRAFT_259849 [Cubamyces lactineus]
MDCIPPLPQLNADQIDSLFAAAISQKYNPTRVEYWEYLAWSCQLRSLHLFLHPQAPCLDQVENNDGKIKNTYKLADFSAMAMRRLHPLQRPPPSTSCSFIKHISFLLGNIPEVLAHALLAEGKVCPDVTDYLGRPDEPYEKSVWSSMEPACRQIETKAAIIFSRYEPDPNTNYIIGLAMSGPFWSWRILARPEHSRGPTRYEDPNYLSPSTPSSDSGADVHLSVPSSVMPSSRPPSRAASLSARSQISAALSEEDAGSGSRGSDNILADVSHERPSDESDGSALSSDKSEESALSSDDLEESSHHNPEAEGNSRAVSGVSIVSARELSSPTAELRPELEMSPSQSRPQKRRRLRSPSPDDEGDGSSGSSEGASSSENEDRIHSESEIGNSSEDEDGAASSSSASTYYERPVNLPSVEVVYPEMIRDWSPALPPWTHPEGRDHLKKFWNALFLCFPVMWDHYNQERSA